MSALKVQKQLNKHQINSFLVPKFPDLLVLSENKN